MEKKRETKREDALALVVVVAAALNLLSRSCSPPTQARQLLSISSDAGDQGYTLSISSGKSRGYTHIWLPLNRSENKRYIDRTLLFLIAVRYYCCLIVLIDWSRLLVFACYWIAETYPKLKNSSVSLEASRRRRPNLGLIKEHDLS